MNSGGGALIENAFYRQLSRHGSWIGKGAAFSNWPVFPHGCTGVFISGGASIGKDCVIFHQVTIGSNTLIDSKGFGAPRLGDNCYIGAGAKIIGNIRIGNNCRIGANTVIAKDVPDDMLVVPAEGRMIMKRNMDNHLYNKDSDGNWGYYENGIRVVNKDIGKAATVQGQASTL